LIGLILTLLLSTEPTVINCVYDGTKSAVACPGSKPIPVDWSADPFDEWLWHVQYRGGEVDYNLPLVKSTPKHGAILKAELAEDGRWYALAGCEVRIQRRLHEHAKHNPGEIAPLVLWEPPTDCQKKN
jgi:hypothetical protein